MYMAIRQLISYGYLQDLCGLVDMSQLLCFYVMQNKLKCQADLWNISFFFPVQADLSASANTSGDFGGMQNNITICNLFIIFAQEHLVFDIHYVVSKLNSFWDNFAGQLYVCVEM